MQPKHSELWHHLTEEDVFEALNSHQHQGLDASSITERQRLFGANIISSRAATPAWKRLLLQFHNPLIYILLIATLVTFFLQEYVDAGVILAVVLINALIGFIQESKAEAAINSLKNLLSAQARVIRDGQVQTISASELVPGDLLILASGDKVSADIRLYECKDLQIDESALTGESVASQKTLRRLDKDTLLADRQNMAFAGTLVTYGTGKGVVIATGDHTETGKIAHMIAEATQIDTPLTRKIHAFSRLLLWVILGLALATFAIGLLYGMAATETFMAAVALAVAAIPEGLPAVVTITLAIGVRRMAKRNAIIRTLSAVETLGSTTVICSDKTGTLTENQMTVQAIFAAGHRYQISGSGYQPEGEITPASGSPELGDNLALQHCLRAGLISNDSLLKFKSERWQVEGDPTEGALITAALKSGLESADCHQDYPRLDSIPFESDRQYMATLHATPQGEKLLYLKGSVEQVLKRCKEQMTSQGQTENLNSSAINAQVETLAAQGLRVLAFACQKLPSEVNNLDAFQTHEAEEQLCFIGLQAMIDPPRAEAIRAVATCQSAGINIKMITGDHALTAGAIAKQIGILSAEESLDQGKTQKVLTGRDLAEMSDHELLDCVEQVSVYARVAPEQKLKLVTALQAHSQVVAMTGDGVNDAPALKQADIGIAMGLSGTEVAKEASDMVLTDDNFSSIEAAVEEGRTVFDNLIKFISWILPTNLGQGLVIMLAILLGVTLPVLPVQALWLNMTTAVFLGLMLAFEPKEPGIMTRAPREPNSPILSVEMIGRIVSVSSLLLLGAFGLFQWSQSHGASLEESRTLAVTLFVIVQSFFLLNCRSLSRSLFKTEMLSNLWIWGGIAAMLLAQLLFIYLPIMNQLFHSAPLSFNYWLVMLAYGAAVLLLVELEKALWRRHKIKQA
ncbi:cation-translocating P-type ATPase [Nitrincola tapanii]|uniref:Cation-transporting P-type ATPase n=1 Tax=Nitrincola tapanii TaxID=1708751 RepID=A0A5A9W3I9_9GAMM|nr:cation-transporting P-type ATPase [Nitrincola tapanii]KAA0875103.1 cation-transporting P-type ATPase [Nitrincola tapanii]